MDGHFLDTQRYIAHNDEIIILAYHSATTTSVFDWLTNFNSTSSAWEIEEDHAKGYSSCCSGMDGLCCTGNIFTPKVHTGFYNNFLASLFLIKKHIEPMLALDMISLHEKLYVMGHSLGADVATLAACYFMNQPWIIVLAPKLLRAISRSTGTFAAQNLAIFFISLELMHTRFLLVNMSKSSSKFVEQSKSKSETTAFGKKNSTWNKNQCPLIFTCYLRSPVSGKVVRKHFYRLVLP